MPKPDRRKRRRDGGVPLREYFEALRAADEKLHDERDHRYATTFEASEKAIVKAEDAQRAYNAAHNDLAKKMDEQNKATMPRIETESRFKGMEEKLALLTGSFTEGTGAAQGTKETKEDLKATIAVIVSIAAAVVGAISFFAGKG